MKCTIMPRPRTKQTREPPPTTKGWLEGIQRKLMEIGYEGVLSMLPPGLTSPEEVRLHRWRRIVRAILSPEPDEQGPASPSEARISRGARSWSPGHRLRVTRSRWLWFPVRRRRSTTVRRRRRAPRWLSYSWRTTIGGWWLWRRATTFS